MDWVRLDRDCTHYATFQSHNQKVVRNRNGIFLSYLSHHEAPENDDGWKSRSRWRLLRSVDGGATFRPLLSREIVGNKPPAIETDAGDNLLLAGEDGTDPLNAHYFLRLSAADGYRAGPPVRLPPQVLGKFSMVLDEKRGRLCFFDHYGWLYLIDPATGAHDLVKVMHQEGPNAWTQYPHAFLDGTGTLHHAWTTQRKGRYLYWDIHYARSPDLGRTWAKADGTPLGTPFVPDDGGPTDAIVPPDELGVHTWLSSMIERDGTVHFAYRARSEDGRTSRQHHVRLELGTGRLRRADPPGWTVEGVSIDSLDGFFATRRDDPSFPLCYVSRTSNRELAAVASDDGGGSWRILEVSGPLPAGRDFYSIGGCREATPEGFLIGTFTSQQGKRGDPHFFRIAVPGARSRLP